MEALFARCVNGENLLIEIFEEKGELPMEAILLITSAVILFGLTKSTEKVLDIRQGQRDQGKDIKTYL